MRPFLIPLGALSLVALPLLAQAPAAPRRPVPMDSARAVQLYVSNRLEDHPVSDYARAIREKAETDSIFAARSRGVMRYEKTTYRSRHGDLDIPVYVFAPLVSRGARAHAAMVWVHGGVHGNWDQNYLPFIIEATQRGYVVVAPEYRGSTGYGAAFHNAIDYGGRELDDVEDAIDFLQGRAEVDPARIGIMGWSHGGYITALLLMRGEQARFVAGAAIVPVTNLVFRLSYKGPSYQRSFATQATLGGLPFEQREAYIRRSPYYHVDALARPLLVHAATNDTDVDFVEGRMLIDALRARKPELAETKVYVDPAPGPASQGHTFSRRVNRETLLREDSPAQIDSWNLTWAFFARHLRPDVGVSTATRAATNVASFSGPNPWPAIRQARIRTLLPAAMRETGIDAWVSLFRENANDPLALHLGGENAGAPSAVIVTRQGDAVRTVMLSGFGEAIALRELGVHDSVVVYDGSAAALNQAIATRLRAAGAKRIAINSGEASGIADGMSATQRRGLERALGPEWSKRLVASHDLVQAWLAIKLPAEVEIMSRAAQLTAQLEEEAYAQVVPGVTRDSDIARYLKARMRDLGVEDGWSPSQNPSVNSGPDRGHSHASDRVIEPGDVIQTDFGIRVHGVWVTDIQRFAYVLRPGETAPPADVQRTWAIAKAGSRAAFAAMRPGATGAQVDSAQRLIMHREGSTTVPWSTGHPVGYWAHDAGPRLNRAERRPLREGMTFAYDGFMAWALPGSDGTKWGEGTKTISVEEMTVITRDGARFLTPPQEELILIPARGPARP
ncbi:MAG: prolyl oligopeptidase family serine peptidase [Gemmatimonadetes bacterium]|nr:prolyl oligopeptidase family serine peptidase [Gemmatimonadota bacterium]